MALAKTRYRVRGLPEIPTEQNKSSKPKKKVADKTEVQWESVRIAIDRPSLDDYLHLSHTWGLQEHWPTCAFINRAQQARPIKSLPMALADQVLGTEDSLTAQIHEKWEHLKTEKSCFEALLKTAKEGTEPDFADDAMSPVCLAFATYLFRGSSSFKKHRAEVLARILSRPEASYLALLSGVWSHDGKMLIDSVRRDPKLAVDAWRYPEFLPLTFRVAPEYIHRNAPHLYSLIQPIHIGIIRSECWTNLAEAANENVMAAAFALALAPGHADNARWTAIIQKDAEAMYWTVRIASQGIDPTSLGYWPHFQKRVRDDAQWGYHWVRDFEPGSAYAFFDAHWPSPWSIELAVDLHLSKSVLLDQHSRTKDSEALKGEYGDALAIWLCNYIKDDENEES
jgi:hypothetical protein